MKRAFIFDMDGVIIDSEPLHSKIKLLTLRHYGLDFDESGLSFYMGRKTKEFFEAVIARDGRSGLPDPDEMVDWKHAAYLKALDADREIAPVKGIPELIAGLKERGFRLGLASSAGEVIIRAVLKRFALTDSFEVVISGAGLAKSKPDPAIYRLAAEGLGVRAEECIVLEDAASGVAAAKAAGMYCIAYRNPHSGIQDLAAADMRVEEIAEILPAVDKLPR